MSISDIHSQTGMNTRSIGWPQVAFGVLLASLLLIPLGIDNAFVSHVFITICLFAALSTAWNIVGGFAGQLSLGHAVFYGIGGYAGVILFNLGVTPWIGMFVGAGARSTSVSSRAPTPMASASAATCTISSGIRWRWSP